jgi:hypothetical protein
VYRVKQFWWALRARLPADAWSSIKASLTTQQLALFRTMSPSDQRHSLDVYRALLAAGQTDRDLLVAALLHDVGKAGGQLHLWHRVAIVLLRAFWPAALKRLSQGEARGWRTGFVIHRRHPELGADQAEAAGCSPLTVALIRRHQDPPAANPGRMEEDRLLAALQRADGIS